MPTKQSISTTDLPGQASAHTVAIVGREVIAHKTIALFLERPAGFSFVAGQNIDVTVVDPPEPDPEGGSRTFSIASAPFEDQIMIAVRLRNNPYKRALETLPIGSPIQIDGPYGSFVLHNDSSIPAVFIAGGIGIAPILSILREAAEQGCDHRLTLFYANRRIEDAAYYDELEALADALPNFAFIPTMTRPETSGHPWTGECGYIDGPMLKRSIRDVRTPIYFAVGPSRMVWGTMTLLDGLVDKSKVKLEDFTGF